MENQFNKTVELEALKAEVASMQNANTSRLWDGLALAYNEEDFAHIAGAMRSLKSCNSIKIPLKVADADGKAMADEISLEVLKEGIQAAMSIIKIKGLNCDRNHVGEQVSLIEKAAKIK